MDAAPASWSELKQRHAYETARIDLMTLDFRIRNLEAELGRLNPAREKLQAAQRELDEGLLRYTDQNPRVQELRSRVESVGGACWPMRWIGGPPAAGSRVSDRGRGSSSKEA